MTVNTQISQLACGANKVINRQTPKQIQILDIKNISIIV